MVFLRNFDGVGLIFWIVSVLKMQLKLFHILYNYVHLFNWTVWKWLVLNIEVTESLWIGVEGVETEAEREE